MTKMMKVAIEVLRDLPEDRQDIVARAIPDYASEEDVDVLTVDEQREVRAGLAEIERCEIATDAKVAATYNQLWALQKILAVTDSARVNSLHTKNSVTKASCPATRT